MIKSRNTGELIAVMTINGAQTSTAGGVGTTESFVVPGNYRLKSIFARLGVAGVTGTQTTDLLKNGSSMVSSGTLLSYATGSQSPTYGNANLSTNPPTFVKGDILQLKNTAVQTTAAIDQVVILVLERTRSGSWADVVQTDTLGADFDAIG